MESMRAVGYTLETAIADIIDNSISAEATRVDIFFNSEKPDHLAILDNGHGMASREICHAMRLAGRNPSSQRGDGDLGRFGLGLKTASLSQCRSLTVVSKRAGGDLAGYVWDLDHLAETGRWSLMELTATEIADLPRIDGLSKLASGTLVLWRKLDRLTGAPGTSRASLDDQLLSARQHLALVFHRYLAGESGRPFSIAMNQIEPPRIDPFLGHHRATQLGRTESFEVEGQTVTVRPYTLPFLNKLTARDRELAGTGATLRDTQGLYIYRQLRLVIWGTWFRIVPKDDDGRLARVQVEIPNTLDHLWALDIKKSAAVPPPEVRSKLRRIVDRIVEPSRSVHRYRGRKASNADPVTHVWELIEERDGFRYGINRQHPLISNLASIGGGLVERSVDRVLSLIENSFPVHDAYNRMGADQAVAAAPIESDELLSLAVSLWEATGRDSGSVDDFVMALRYVEPFNSSADAEAILRKASGQ